MMPKQKNRYRKSNKRAGSKIDLPDLDIEIDAIGHQGDGIGFSNNAGKGESGQNIKLYVPHAAVGDMVTVKPIKKQGDGYLATIKTIYKPAPQRKNPECQAFPGCGGCQFQHLKIDAYENWKAENLKNIISNQSLEPQEWRESFFAKPNNRRRARIAYRRLQDRVICGFREHQSHHIIPPLGCVILRPEIKDIITALQNDILMHLDVGQTGEIELTHCDNGMDITLRPNDRIEGSIITKLTTSSGRYPIARLSMVEPNGDVTMLITQKLPIISWHHLGQIIKTTPAPAGFMQADQEAERLMQSDILAMLKGCQKVADLFCGGGTLSLPLLMTEHPPKTIVGFDHGGASLQTMLNTAKQAGYHHNVHINERNLFKDPVMSSELDGFDAAIIDPPRAGALAQIEQIIDSDIPKIMMVSCNPISFARDAKILEDNDYTFKWIRMIDQFRLTSHIELVAYFELSS